jgi:hypothetical protein
MATGPRVFRPLVATPRFARARADPTEHAGETLLSRLTRYAPSGSPRAKTRCRAVRWCPRGRRPGTGCPGPARARPRASAPRRWRRSTVERGGLPVASSHRPPPLATARSRSVRHIPAASRRGLGAAGSARAPAAPPRAVGELVLPQHPAVRSLIAAQHDLVRLDRAHLLAEPHPTEAEVRDSVGGARVGAAGDGDRHLLGELGERRRFDDRHQEVVQIARAGHRLRAVRRPHAAHQIRQAGDAPPGEPERLDRRARGLDPLRRHALQLEVLPVVVVEALVTVPLRQLRHSRSCGGTAPPSARGRARCCSRRGCAPWPSTRGRSGTGIDHRVGGGAQPLGRDPLRGEELEHERPQRSTRSAGRRP